MSPPALIQLEGYACTFLYGIPLIKKAFVKLYHSKLQMDKNTSDGLSLQR